MQILYLYKYLRIQAESNILKWKHAWKRFVYRFVYPLHLKYVMYVLYFQTVCLPLKPHILYILWLFDSELFPILFTCRTPNDTDTRNFRILADCPSGTHYRTQPKIMESRSGRHSFHVAYLQTHTFTTNVRYSITTYSGTWPPSSSAAVVLQSTGAS